jgi:ribonuclease D
MSAGWIRTPEALARLAQELRAGQAFALDSESDSLYHHFDKVCLVQLATEGGDAWLLDPLALRDLSPLAPAMADPAVTKVLHGADYDVTTLKRDFGFTFTRLFDTMIAARFLGMAEIGLMAVARRELGVELSKGSQKDDWSRRPLSPAQEEYALADVRHLLALHARLAERLRAAGRLAWVEEECAAVAALEPARRKKDPDAYQKVKGVRRLDPRRQAVLRELLAWREGRAELTDVPPFKIAGNETLLALAEAAPRDRPALTALRLNGRLLEQAPALLAAVERGLRLPESELPRLPRVPRPNVSDTERRRGEALRAWRARRAAADGLEASVILPQRLIDRLAAAAPRHVDALDAIEGLRRWRREAFGEEIVRALA